MGIYYKLEILCVVINGMIKKIENLGEGLGVLRKNVMEKFVC